MSGTALLGIGVKAMSANYAALQTSGNNIANATVAGYSRQQVELATSPGQFTGGGYFGRGVDISTVSRSHDTFLTSQAMSSKSLAAMDTARYGQLQSLEKIFVTGEQGLGDATSQLFSAMTDVASNPADLSSRQVVLARANDMATRFASASNSLDTLQSSATAELSSSVAQINSLTQGIAQANQRIAGQLGTGQPPNDLLDERDRLISKLAEQVQITRVDDASGSAAIFIAGGQRLVLGSEALQVQLAQDPADPRRSALAVIEGPTRRVIDTSSLGGGSVAGLLNFQNIDLVQARNLVGRLAASVSAAVNSQQARGVNLQPPLGQTAGAALFSTGSPVALANANNVKDGNGNPIGGVALTVVDPTALQPSDYALRATPGAPGTWQLTRLMDGTVQTVASGDVVDGVRIDLNNLQPTDRFLLQPVGRAASGMAGLLTDPRDIAAASPLVASTADANTGTASVSSITVTSFPSPTPGATTQISFTDNTGGYDWQLLDASGSPVGGGSGQWVAGQAIPAAPEDYNGFSLQLSGVPRAGDIVSVTPTPANAVATNNGNAVALAALRDAPLATGHTATDTYATALADVGVGVQSAKTSSDLSTAAASQAEQSRTSQAGVNLDEEAARLIQYQQSYQAAAKVLQVAQALFDSLLQSAGR
jgi:flagellar hook-associated protein 1 FlgK